jgi:signal peptidase II
VKKTTLLLLLPALAVIALDQISKFFLARTIPEYGSVPVIEGFFNLVHVRNRGMAFGLMNRPEQGLPFYLLVAATIAAIALLLFWFRKMKDEDHKITIGLGLILGGAVGNFIDRIRLGEVIDFLDFSAGPYHWPAFNVADTAITVGILWLAVNLIIRNPPKGEDHS